LRIEAASGGLLILAAATALLLANSRWAATYTGFWQMPVGFRLGELVFERPLTWLVNDGLMVVFFFVVGLEIKREIHCGELSEWRRAALPVAAALGGMLAPAGIYFLMARGPMVRAGWGTPMATDIAFAVGVLALLGKRVPAALRVLLLALAVIDDLGAIVVIALFYSSHFAPIGLLIAAAGMLAIAGLQRLGTRARMAYLPAGLVIWAGFYEAGIHPTIAGVVIGLMTPVRAWLGAEGFFEGIKKEVKQLEVSGPSSLSVSQLASSVHHVDAVRREALSPAEQLIEQLHPWVAYGVMPVFALANAGVRVDVPSIAGEGGVVATATALGLVFGKPLGILLAIFVALKLGLARLPLGITWRHLTVLGAVSGVGFTMAIFIAQLAFTQEALLSAAKIGVLAASAFAAVLAVALGRLALPAACATGAAETADDAEASTEH
jgi:NhaA family Na+:H+ antiporter